MNKDLITRALWTLAQAGVGVAITVLASVPAWWAAPIALVLSALKTWLMGKTTSRTPNGATVAPPVPEAKS